METILLFLPTIFSFFTGILVSWGIYLCVVLAFFSADFKNDTGKLVKNVCLVSLCTVNIFLLLLLFIFTSFTAFHMVTIIFIEIWYITFLYRVTIAPWNTPCHVIINAISNSKTTPIIQKPPLVIQK